MIEISNDNFQEMKEGLVLMDFWSPVCVKCMNLMPEVHKFEEQYGDKIKFTSLNVTKARRFAIGQAVMGLPTIAIYKDGVVIERITSYDVTKESIEDLIKRHIE